MTNLVFSQAKSQDVADINRLVNSAYRGEQSKKGWTTEADMLDGIRTDEEQLAAMMKDQNSVFIVGKDKEEKLQASVYLQKQGDKLYLGMLTVNPELQTAGIGKQLMEEAERYAAQVQCTAITMTVITKRTELIAWYERRGYRQTGEHKPFPADPKFGIQKEPLEFLIMEKHLSPSN
jgi:ribosomal protein S18 acetylase RimI-like enzyme